jgi:CDP-glucose 4,6-dehydratase
MASQLFWADRRVAVTGHTGFKGAWLCTWLDELGAEVTGIGLPPATEPSLFAMNDLPRRVHSRIADVRSHELLARHLREAEPEIIFHLAAQPLVLKSLQDPVATFQSNILGVVNLLDAARRLPSVRTVVVVTSDKCYLRPDRRCVEGDALGGHDPYSASKACAEIITEA